MQKAVADKLAAASPMDKLSAGFKDVTSSGAKALDFAKSNAYPLGSLGISALGSMGSSKLNAPPVSTGMIRPYTFERTQNEIQPQDRLSALYTPGQSSRERDYFKDRYTAGTPYAAPGPEYPKMAEGGEVEAYKYDPTTRTYSGGAGTPANEYYAYTYNPTTQRYAKAFPDATKAAVAAAAEPLDSNVYQAVMSGGMASGGIATLGGYSDGGQLLRGPGDGVSDSIPAMIGQKQQARLADGEFVVPARIVSELGNGSTEAGARQLYAMMDRVQNARKKSVGKDKVAADTKANRLLPA
jgi:hypothetical protein